MAAEIFSRYANGERISDIKRDLEARGIRSNRGNPYSVGSLSNLLKNRKYIGEYKYGDVIIPDGIPAIIDKELFERVQGDRLPLLQVQRRQAAAWLQEESHQEALDRGNGCKADRLQGADR